VWFAAAGLSISHETLGLSLRFEKVSDIQRSSSAQPPPHSRTRAAVRGTLGPATAVSHRSSLGNMSIGSLDSMPRAEALIGNTRPARVGSLMNEEDVAVLEARPTLASALYSSPQATNARLRPSRESSRLAQAPSGDVATSKKLDQSAAVYTGRLEKSTPEPRLLMPSRLEAIAAAKAIAARDREAAEISRAKDIEGFSAGETHFR
jgi:hypothetical protein